MKSLLYSFLSFWNTAGALFSCNPRKILNRGVRLGMGKVSGSMLRGISRHVKF